MGGVVNKHTGRENARFIARLYGIDPDYMEAFTRWLTGISEYYDMPVGTYSSGMRARFSFALLLALEFDIYLIDEGMPGTTDAEFNRKAGSILRERLEQRDRGDRVASGLHAGEVLQIGGSHPGRSVS